MVVGNKGKKGTSTGVAALEQWARSMTSDYKNVSINNMTSSWKNGLAFCAIIHHFRPDLLNFDKLEEKDVYENNLLAFSIAEHLGIPSLLDAEDMAVMRTPDRLSIITYVAQLHQYFRDKEPIDPASVSSDKQRHNVPKIPNIGGDGTLKKTSVSDEAESSTKRVSNSCAVCKKRIYLLERLMIDGRFYHRQCFCCVKCGEVLKVGLYRSCIDHKRDNVSIDNIPQYECLSHGNKLQNGSSLGNNSKDLMLREDASTSDSRNDYASFTGHSDKHGSESNSGISTQTFLANDNKKISLSSHPSRSSESTNCQGGSDGNLQHNKNVKQRGLLNVNTTNSGNIVYSNVTKSEISFVVKKRNDDCSYGPNSLLKDNNIRTQVIPPRADTIYKAIPRNLLDSYEASNTTVSSVPATTNFKFLKSNRYEHTISDNNNGSTTVENRIEDTTTAKPNKSSANYSDPDKAAASLPVTLPLEKEFVLRRTANGKGKMDSKLNQKKDLSPVIHRRNILPIGAFPNVSLSDDSIRLFSSLDNSKPSTASNVKSDAGTKATGILRQPVDHSHLPSVADLKRSFQQDCFPIDKPNNAAELFRTEISLQAATKRPNIKDANESQDITDNFAKNRSILVKSKPITNLQASKVGSSVSPNMNISSNTYDVINKNLLPPSRDVEDLNGNKIDDQNSTYKPYEHISKHANQNKVQEVDLPHVNDISTRRKEKTESKNVVDADASGSLSLRKKLNMDSSEGVNTSSSAILNGTGPTLETNSVIIPTDERNSGLSNEIDGIFDFLSSDSTGADNLLKNTDEDKKITMKNDLTQKIQSPGANVQKKSKNPLKSKPMEVSTFALKSYDSRPMDAKMLGGRNLPARNEHLNLKELPQVPLDLASIKSGLKPIPVPSERAIRKTTYPKVDSSQSSNITSLADINERANSVKNEQPPEPPPIAKRQKAISSTTKPEPLPRNSKKLPRQQKFISENGKEDAIDVDKFYDAIGATSTDTNSIGGANTIRSTKTIGDTNTNVESNTTGYSNTIGAANTILATNTTGATNTIGVTNLIPDTSNDATIIRNLKSSDIATQEINNQEHTKEPMNNKEHKHDLNKTALNMEHVSASDKAEYFYSHRPSLNIQERNLNNEKNSRNSLCLDGNRSVAQTGNTQKSTGGFQQLKISTKLRAAPVPPIPPIRVKSPFLRRIGKSKPAPPRPLLQKRKIRMDMNVSITDVQKMLSELDQKHNSLEAKAKDLEIKLRKPLENPKVKGADHDVELLEEWLSLINEKNDLVREETELVYIKRELDLDEVHSEVEYELRCLSQKLEHEKSEDHDEREKTLLTQLVEIVREKNALVDAQEEERIRQLEEDTGKSIREQKLGELSNLNQKHANRKRQKKKLHKNKLKK